MINYNSFTLENGLKVIVHEDASTPMACVNILYNVGARDEVETRTGFAHLFEHLMFEGSKNIPNFDTPLQNAGGSNNAFTNNDITNYYDVLPSQNIETAFWLESDRMLELGFSQEKLDIQKKVVIEEFKQRYLNQPYGDIWLLIRPLIYQKHPYKWATIGKEISHIENATLEEVKNFFFSHYAPNNANMVVAGNVKLEEVKKLAEKYFSEIPKREIKTRNLPKEDEQKEQRRLTVEREVPADLILIAFNMGGKNDADYIPCDLITDILSGGKTSRLYQTLVKEKQIFSEIGAYVMGSIDPGLLVISGKLHKNHSIAEGEKAIWDVLDEFKKNGINENELTKVKNKLLTSEKFSLMNILNVAMKLSLAEWQGNIDLVNTEMKKYQTMTKEEIVTTANKLFRTENSNVLEYKSIKK